jgi:hypothetical protein
VAEGERETVEPNGVGQPVTQQQTPLFGDEAVPNGVRSKPIKGVYPFGEVASALQKEIRRGAVREAVFWGLLLYEAAPYYCVDEETECLSDRGWLSGLDLKVDDRIVTMNPESRLLEWAPVESVYRAPYQGPMVRVAGRHLDMLVTPDHSWFVHWRYGDRWERVETRNLRPSHSIPLTAEPGMPERNLLPDDLLRVLGWAVTEGSYHRDYRRPEGVKEIVIGQLAASPRCEQIRAALRGVQARWSETVSGKMRLFNIVGVIKDRIIALAPNRTIRWDVVAKLSGRQAALLRDTMLLGDGSIARRSGRSDTWIFGQLLGPRLEVFQAITMLAGDASNQQPKAVSGFGKKPVGTVTVKRMRRVQWGHQKPQIVEYAGVVWCPTTRNGTFLARRGGKTHITGNCWKRVLVTSAEDIGLAAPEVVDRVANLALSWRIAREKSWYVTAHHLTMAIVLLCRAPKSTEIEDLQTLTLQRIKAGERPEIPPYAKDAHTESGKQAGRNWKDWYRDRHGVCGVPVNEFTLELWEKHPEWDPR